MYALALGLGLFGFGPPGFFLSFLLLFLLISFVLLCSPVLRLLCQDRLDELPCLLLPCIPYADPVLRRLLQLFGFPSMPGFDPWSLLWAWRLRSSDVDDQLLESDVGWLVPRVSGLGLPWCGLGCWCLGCLCGLLQGCLPRLKLL